MGGNEITPERKLYSLYEYLQDQEAATIYK